jgi:hypothetical protein
MAMRIKLEDLLPAEAVIEGKNANLVLRPTDYLLAPIMHGPLVSRTGFSGQEAIGGRLYLTSYRLIFKSHAVNRVTGSVSIFLPTITGLQDTSRGISKRLTVHTAMLDYDLVVWGIPQLIEAIKQQAAIVAGAPERWQEVVQLIRADPARALGGMKLSRGVTTLQSKNVRSILEDVTDPFSAACSLNLAALLDEGFGSASQEPGATA